jgi:RES domain-containing protein
MIAAAQPGEKVRTVAIPIWANQGINAWMTAAGIEDGRLLRSVSKSGKINRDTLSGLYYSARWNTAGHRIVYLAESPAGALVESLVRTELNERNWPRFYDLMQSTAPDEIEIETLNVSAGDDWKRLPIITRGLGDDWLNSKRPALVRVPSAIMPNTWNVLLNPEHLAAGQIRIIETTKVDYDPRLFQKLGV